jgi:hypothetical protein
MLNMTTRSATPQWSIFDPIRTVKVWIDGSKKFCFRNHHLVVDNNVYYAGQSGCPIIVMDIAKQVMKQLDITPSSHVVGLVPLTNTQIIIQYVFGQTDVLNIVTNQIEQNHVNAPETRLYFGKNMGK